MGTSWGRGGTRRTGGLGSRHGIRSTAMCGIHPPHIRGLMVCLPRATRGCCRTLVGESGLGAGGSTHAVGSLLSGTTCGGSTGSRIRRLTCAISPGRCERFQRLIFYPRAPITPINVGWPFTRQDPVRIERVVIRVVQLQVLFPLFDREGLPMSR